MSETDETASQQVRADPEKAWPTHARMRGEKGWLNVGVRSCFAIFISRIANEYGKTRPDPEHQEPLSGALDLTR
jgi:hypothetical protein